MLAADRRGSPMEQHIQFVTAPDGVGLAVATTGSGPPLLIVPGWISHLEMEWNFPPYRSFYERLARNHLLVRYDKRGTGLSDRNVSDLSPEANVRDLDAIAHALSLRKVTLLGYSQGGPISIAYAVEHPDNVSGLILYGAYHDGSTLHFRRLMDAFVALIREDWGGYGGASMIDMYIPGAPPELREIYAEFQRQAASAEDAAATLVSSFNFVVSDLLDQITAPTLVLHRRGDKACPFEQAREIAARIPGARFVPLAGDIHAIMLGDTEPLLTAIDEFLGEGEEAAAQGTPSGLVTLLFTDMEGSTTLTQRLGDAKAQEVLRTHNTILRDALKAHSGSETKHTGDGIMASFASASGALQSAIDMQRALSAHNESNPDIPIRVRIGLNAGEPVVEEEDLFGTAVQLAARICAHAEPGQILASDLVKGLAAGKRFLFADHGDVALRGFEEPVRLYEVRWQQ
jgi:class 3 adenylate cyclase